ncbi:D-alanyl-D-alanine carboxypeptidase/D-alanyl-D-alanine-endopeptidase [Bacillus dakarensis]|uniref:D-alanyl-D-alanine carboxypeptidase/D-alanyl-D-alanine endopeptidase n=1 Tax=Robertmurraya dakarensis TaxID=1926278 RepID=UPI00137A38E5|nr:D-alanyl-D-alanine carboxypeptidase/D-alanyl-D-alanine-endopeptidase [Bacillus dakarensis]
MKNQSKVYILFFLLALASTFFSIQTEANSELTKTVNQQVHGTDFSIAVRDLNTGELVYEYYGNNGIKPASTLKLLTAAAALEVLGEDYFFSTQMLMDGTIQNGVLHGNIYLRGEGDPTLQVKDFVTFSNTLKKKGIVQINGNIYGDDTWFTGARLSPGIWPEDETYYYGAPISALTTSPDNDFDVSTVIVNAAPARVGSAPSISVQPNASGLRLINQAKTVSRGSKNTLKIERKYRTNQIIISGNLPQGSSKKEWVTMFNPTLSTIHSFKNTLTAQGIKFGPDSKVDYATVPSQAVSLGTKRSQPLKQIMPVFMKLSNNGIADILVKTMGKKVHNVGDWEHGLKVLREYGKSIGLDMNQWKFEDGSGISHENRVNAVQQTLLLVKQPQQPYYQRTFLSSLPVGGQRDRSVGGTLRNRYIEPGVKNRVTAKTGSLDGVSTLAGYVQGDSGKWYAFSILVEHKGSSYTRQIDTVVRKMMTIY